MLALCYTQYTECDCCKYKLILNITQNLNYNETIKYRYNINNLYTVCGGDI